MRKRGFEVISKYQSEIEVPVRATKHAAGYDFSASEDCLIPSVWRQGVINVIKNKLQETVTSDDEKLLKPTLVPTGIKAYMGEDEYLQLANRSSNPLKRFLILANGVGIIDADYYNNPDNEGHIMFQFLNFGFKDVKIKRGERIGQGIFMPFLKADNDRTTVERVGGFGSSGK